MPRSQHSLPTEHQQALLSDRLHLSHGAQGLRAWLHGGGLPLSAELCAAAGLSHPGEGRGLRDHVPGRAQAHHQVRHEQRGHQVATRNGTIV